MIHESRLPVRMLQRLKAIAIGKTAFLLIASIFIAQVSPGEVTVQRGDGPGTFQVTFHFQDADAKSVSVAGSFNEWNSSTDPMQLQQGAWTKTLPLRSGRHEYKFVIGESDWRGDPDNPSKSDDGHGGFNSVIEVSEAAVSKSSSAESSNSQKQLHDDGVGTRVEPIPGGKSRVTFKFVNAGAKSVHVAGSFNGWSSDQAPMVKSGDAWTTTIILSDDEYQYKYVVNGSEWKEDPANPAKSDDGHGGSNSVLRLGPLSKIEKSQANRADSEITTSALFHDPASVEFFNPLPHGEGAVLKVRALAHDVTTAVLAQPERNPIPLRSEFEDERFEFFRVKIAKNQILPYKFGLTDGGDYVMLGSNGAGKDADVFKPQIDESKIFSTPKWAGDVVWYEIFPERFRNGSKKNDPTTNTRAWTSEWSKSTPEEAADPFGIYGRRYGGDLQGCFEKLPYLKKLGVGAIWFNPVFQSESLHKYDAQDYRHIDEGFGAGHDYDATAAAEDLLDPKTWKFSESDRLFLEFVKAAHAQGIKVIIDGVFNHTGTRHPAFKDVQKNGRASRFAEWFNIISWDPLKWEGWGGYDLLPVLKENEKGFVDPSLRAHLHAITRRWMDPNGDGDPSDGIDGWRLDVPNEVSSDFWKEWRQTVKSVNPDAVIIGEIWDPAAKWLRGDQLDSVMNYQFAKAVFRYLGNDGKASDFGKDLARLRHAYPDQANDVMLNLLNSHDTDRFVSMLFNPGRQYDERNRMQDVKPGQPGYNNAKPGPEVYGRLKQAVALQFCWIGSPMIYYGDEAGMWGADDPENRKPMIWEDLQPYDNAQTNKFMPDVFAWYERCAAMRNTLPALATGDFQQVLAQDANGLFAFRRWEKADDVIVIVNNGDSAVKVDLRGSGKEYVNVLGESVKVVPGEKLKRTRLDLSEAKAIPGQGGMLNVSVPARSTMVLATR